MVKWQVVMAVFLVAGCAQQVVSDPAEPTPSATQTPSPAPSPEPTPDVGNGQDGPLIAVGDQVVNTCTPLLGTSSDNLVVESSAGFEAGDRVFVFQMQDEFGVSGPTTTITDSKNAGIWEVTRVTAVDGNFLTAEADLLFGYAATGSRRAQVCQIPEFTLVHVPTGARLRPAPWNGTSGGVLAFYANEGVQVDGALDADEMGFIGGAAGSNTMDIDVLGNDPALGAAGGKGEGLDGRSLTLAGRGSLGTGGGGGNGHNAGGGGGANAGAGGQGGRQAVQVGSQHTNTPGWGGSPLTTPSENYLVILGGGGGTGHQNNSRAGVGGTGGGIVAVITADLTGAAPITANGGRGDDSLTSTAGGGTDGAGGGGAGGSIWIQVAAAANFTGPITATGGDGGDNHETTYLHGTGGGGGGGRIHLHNATSPIVEVTGGTNGVNLFLNNNAYGATPGGAGVVAPAPEL